MKKYLLMSAITLIPFTQAFAANMATIEAKFTGEGKIVLQPSSTLQPTKDKMEPIESKPIEILSTTPLSTPEVPAGNYNISVYNKETKVSEKPTKPCFEVMNKTL